MSFHSLGVLAACSTALGSVLLATPAEAATRTITLQQNGTGACQVTLPAYESVIRRRPLAIQNEGSSGAFVSCSPASLKGIPANDTLGYTVRLVNRGASVASVSCTGVIGSDGVTSPLPVYLIKNANVGGNSSAVLTWRSLEGYGTTVPFNFQCQLPPGVGISGIELNQTLDVGS